MQQCRGLLISDWQSRVHDGCFLHQFTLDHRLHESCIDCTSVAQKHELELFPVVHRTVEALWFPQQSTIHDSFISHAENTCLRIRCTLFGLSCCCPRLEDFTLHGENQLFQCLQSFLRGHVVNTTVSATGRSTTDHVVRSTTSYDHTRSATMLKWIGLMTPFLTRNDSNQRTPHAHVQSECCAHTSAVKSTVLQFYAVPSLSQEHRRGFRRVQTGSRNYPRPVSCHVPRCPQTPTVILFCAHLTANAVSLQDQPM